jgi:hypothetical protein
MLALTRDKAISFEQCVIWARLRFEELFNNNIQQLLFNFPRDAVRFYSKIDGVGDVIWCAILVGPEACARCLGL